MITVFLLLLSLIACDKAHDQNYVTRVEYDALITATNQELNQQTNAYTQYKKYQYGNYAYGPGLPIERR